MQESVSLRILCEKKRYDLRSPNGHLHVKPLAKDGTGKKLVLILVPGSHKRLASRKHVMCAKNMEARIKCSTLEYQRYEKIGREIASRAAKKGVTKLVSSNCAKILEKESSE
jgi:hypothetical protein